MYRPAVRLFHCLQRRQDARAASGKVFGDLVKVQILDHKPFSKIKALPDNPLEKGDNERRGAANPHIELERSLTSRGMGLNRPHARWPGRPPRPRVRFALCLGVQRRAELTGTSTDDVRVRYAGAEHGSTHLLRVVGKGEKGCFLPLGSGVLPMRGGYFYACSFRAIRPVTRLALRTSALREDSPHVQAFRAVSLA